MVPGEDIVLAFSMVIKVKFGTVIVCFGLTLIVIAGALSFIFFGSLNGIGTIIAAAITGLIVNFINRHCGLWDRRNRRRQRSKPSSRPHSSTISSGVAPPELNRPAPEWNMWNMRIELCNSERMSAWPRRYAHSYAHSRMRIKVSASGICDQLDAQRMEVSIDVNPHEVARVLRDEHAHAGEQRSARRIALENRSSPAGRC
ncbi:hypothetical protein [Bifidobacterium myosotis]|uniref:Uncharacterized protein n=1 Tax=Bifidobacterium myosotis TaxID=1630166 RepID=A0A5M9ZK49_9BIFI|nr:hypothetical protein [Bifidobacterium myosotis]KAA8827987.1 hypothetical protein EMO91_05895 [Bifidobacterium myosotis]